MLTWIKSVQQLPISDAAKNAAYKKYMEDWYVRCSVSGEKILVEELKYWNVDTQRMYASAEQALLDRTTPIVD